MAKLEALKPGIKVTGLVPNQTVTVVEVKWHGADGHAFRQAAEAYLFDPVLAVFGYRRAWSRSKG